MSASALVRLEQEIAILAGRLTPPAAPMSRLAMASRLGLTLDEWQVEALTSDARQVIFNIHRQGGKSTAAAILGLHEALTVPDAVVLAVSPGERQSKLLLRTMLRFYKLLDRPVPALIENRLSIEFANGSSIFALPGDSDTIRGFAGVTLVLADEASRIPDEMLAAVRPMLSVSNGRLVTMSTPAGRRGWWWAAWDQGGDDWERYEVPATACPRISPAWLEQERRALPASWFAAEYLCQFTDIDDAAFRGEDVDAAFSEDIRPLFAPLEIAV